MKEIWFLVSPESESTAKSLETAKQAAAAAYVWAMEEMVYLWSSTLERPRASTLYVRFTRYLHNDNQEIFQPAKRYSLNRAIDRAIADFYENTTIKENRVTYPTSVDSERFELQIKSRKIWSKDLLNYGRLSTYYGLLFLEDDWEEQWQNLANELGVKTNLLLYLCHSISLRKNEDTWEVKFNFHQPDSFQGKKARKKVREKP